MHLRAFAAVVLVITGGAAPAVAQQGVTLTFDAGQVTLSAQNAQVRTILAEWARIGGATIVNAERVAGPPVTLELAGVPERQALDVVLRSVAGYIVASRPAGSKGVSAFDRIMILPTSVAPRNPPPASAAAGARPPVFRPGVIARPPDPPENQVETGVEPDPLEDPSTLNQGRDSRVVQPPPVMRPQIQPVNDDGVDQDGDDQQEGAAPAGVAPTPTNPFGVPAGSSATPGVISPAPQPQQRDAPTNRVQ